MPPWEGGHDYIEHYARYFSHLKDEPIKMLEIGYGDGGSAKMWEEYFPNAEIHYLNYPPSDYQKWGHRVGNRVHLHIGNQSNTHDLQQLIAKAGSDFDIIIDDGGHDYKNQHAAFTFLFPHLKKGGCYVVEDLVESYWGPAILHLQRRINPHMRNPSMMLFLKNLVDDMNYVTTQNVSSSMKFCPPELYDKLSYYQKTIYGVLFYPNICFVFKR